MNKTKILKKNGTVKLMLKGQKGQILNESEIFSINNNKVSGLLKFEIIKKKNSFKLLYDITGFISFKDYLKSSPPNKTLFANILQNILDNLQSIQDAYFNQNHILMDFDKVMVNPATQSIYFMYVPIQPFENNASLKEFLLNIVQYCTFTHGEDTSYFKEYIYILNNGVNFSIFELDEYIKSILNTEQTKEQTCYVCPKCHLRLNYQSKYCPECGTKISINSNSLKNRVYNPLENMQENKLFEKKDEHQQIEPTDREYTQDLSDGTTVLGMDDWEYSDETTVLGADELDLPNYPYLIRIKNGEKIVVDKPSFRIGKEKRYCDYFVSDNNAVSRSHADIVTHHKRYFIIDNNSTNRTYVDGKVIQIETEVEIFNGTKIRLANEEFEFFID